MKTSNNKIKKNIFLEPGKNNKEDRINFVKFWANYVKTHSDEDWSEQQNIIINAQMQ
jgi:hypothetical protein